MSIENKTENVLSFRGGAMPILEFALTAIDWLRQEELQEVPPKNGYFQIDGWI